MLKPIGGRFRGTIYTDGSRLDGPDPLTARNGWAFVVFYRGKLVSAALGVPPWRIDDIPGTEAWALLMAARRALPGCEYRSDCLPCVEAAARGIEWCSGDTRIHARVLTLLCHALADTPS